MAAIHLLRRLRIAAGRGAGDLRSPHACRCRRASAGAAARRGRAGRTADHHPSVTAWSATNTWRARPTPDTGVAARPPRRVLRVSSAVHALAAGLRALTPGGRAVFGRAQRRGQPAACTVLALRRVGPTLRGPRPRSHASVSAIVSAEPVVTQSAAIALLASNECSPGYSYPRVGIFVADERGVTMWHFGVPRGRRHEGGNRFSLGSRGPTTPKMLRCPGLDVIGA